MSGGIKVGKRGREERDGSDGWTGTVFQNQFDDAAMQEDVVVAVAAAILDALNLAH